MTTEELYQSGLGIYRIAKLTGESLRTIQGKLSLAGIKRRPLSESNKVYSVNEYCFDSMSVEALYWCGILATDGCINQAKRGQQRIHLGLIDKEWVEKFKSFTGFSGPIYQRTKVSVDGYIRNPIYSFSFASDHVANLLAYHGITQRKTMTLSVSNKLSSSIDFWRGCIDGDGCIYNNNDKLTVELAGAQPLLTQFVEFCRGNSITVESSRHGNIYRVRMKGSKAEKLMNILSYPGCLMLPRKLQKLQTLIKVCRPMSKDMGELGSKIGEGLRPMANTEVTAINSTVEHSG